MNLLLVNKSVDCFPDKSGDNIIDNVYRFETTNRLIRAIRKIHLSLPIPFKGIWLSRYVKSIKNYEKIILFDTGNAKYLINYLHKKIGNKSKLILWFWGPVEISISPNSIDNSKCSIWTFDYNDSQKYHLNLNTQFFFRENIIKSNNNSIDVFFVGTEKNRLEELLRLKKLFESINLSCLFHIVKSNSYYQSKIGFSYSKEISYYDSLKLLSQSRAVLDVVSPEQVGLTLRPLEALFLKKKLITTDTNIVNHKLYNPNNVFIIGVNDISKLKDFINSDYDESLYNENTNYYSFESWINRFDYDLKERN